ncbi:hypothetical protein ABFA07_004501 [Porites harrisoni]
MSTSVIPSVSSTSVVSSALSSISSILPVTSVMSTDPSREEDWKTVGTVSRNTSQVGLLEDGLSLNNGTRLIIILFFVIFEIHIQFKKGFDIKMCAYFCAIAVRV